MPAVKFPDGSKINFPEGTDQETMNRVAADHWAKSQGGAQAAPEVPQEQMRAEADAAVKKEYKDSGFLYDLGDSARNMASGVPVLGGLVDEGLAGANSLMGGDYNKTLEYIRARDRLRSKNFPESTMGQQFAGGIAGTLLGTQALGLGGMGINSAAPLAQRAAAGAAVGVPVGAVDGFTRGEGGAENRMFTAGMGGVLGGLTGAAAPIIGQGLSSAYQGLKNALTPNASFRALGVSQPVGEEIVDSLGNDASKTGLARIRAAGPDAMLADAGPQARGLADAVITKGGPGASYLGTAIESRAKKASKGLVSTLDKTMGAPEGQVAQATAIREGTAAARDAAYKSAYSQPIDYTTPDGQEIASLWSRVRPARREAANALLQESGKPTIKDGALPTVEQIDYVTRALNAVADSGEGQGALGGINDIGRSARNLATKLRQATRTAVPEYANALETAADPISRIEGIKLGTKLLNPQYTRSELMEALDGMTGPERDAVISGIRAQLDEKLANVRGTSSDPEVAARQLNKMVQELTSDATRKKIGMVLGDPKKTMQFFREIGQAFKAAELRAGVAANSRTAVRSGIIKGVDERLQPGVVGTAMEGNLPGATKRAIQVATGATPRQQRLKNNEQWLELAKLLSEKRGREAEALLRKLMAASKTRAASSATGKGIGTAGAGAVAGVNPVLVEGLN